MPATPLRLKMAISSQGHTAALKDGSVPFEGIEPEFINVEPQIAAYRRMVRDVEFDVCDIAPSTYMIAREHGAPFKALPIFVSRNFHHSGFVYRPDAGIGKPKDLEGKNAGVRAYSVTTGVWGRGILQNEYGIDITKITWWVDDEEHVTTLELPPFVKHVPEGKSLVSMMAAGELQAGFTGNAGLGRTGAPKEGWAAGAAKARGNELRRVLQGFDGSSKPSGTAAPGSIPSTGPSSSRIRCSKEHPWVAQSLFKAFTAGEGTAMSSELPSPDKASGKDKQLAELATIVGDPLPYGIAKNRASIEALIKYVHQQGMLKKQLRRQRLVRGPRGGLIRRRRPFAHQPNGNSHGIQNHRHSSAHHLEGHETLSNHAARRQAIGLVGRAPDRFREPHRLDERSGRGQGGDRPLIDDLRLRQLVHGRLHRHATEALHGRRLRGFCRARRSRKSATGTARASPACAFSARAARWRSRPTRSTIRRRSRRGKRAKRSGFPS